MLVAIIIMSIGIIIILCLLRYNKRSAKRRERIKQNILEDQKANEKFLSEKFLKKWSETTQKAKLTEEVSNSINVRNVTKRNIKW